VISSAISWHSPKMFPAGLPGLRLGFVHSIAKRERRSSGNVARNMRASCGVFLGRGAHEAASETRVQLGESTRPEPAAPAGGVAATPGGHQFGFPTWTHRTHPALAGHPEPGVALGCGPPTPEGSGAVGRE
jgi:hypothetical protein